METNFRYKVQHIGDIVADYLDNGFGAAKSKTTGVTLTYQIHELNKKQQKIFTKMGDRLAEIHKTSPAQAVFEDEKMIKLIAKLKEIEEHIKVCQQKRDERLYSKPLASEEG